MTVFVETPAVDHIMASEKYRLGTFSSLLNFPSVTRCQLALAGFLYRDSECVCPQCGVKITLNTVDENTTYSANHFRKLHREKISHLGKRCAFLLCHSGTNIDDLHPTATTQQQDKLQWDDAEHPEFNDYTTRLHTFHSWPYLQKEGNTFLISSAMAKHGFYFSGPQDAVTCFYCGNTLADWLEAFRSTFENIVQLEHARFFPCRFITYTAGGKFVDNAGYLHVVSDQECRSRVLIPLTLVNNSIKPQSIDECLLTFESWPETAPISAKDLAETGFYYLGEELRVKCYMCDLEVDDWRHGMTAVGTHSRRMNTCPIIQAILSTKTSDIQCVNEKWRLETLRGLTLGTDCDERLCRELAACGFYRFKNTSNIRCAYCGVLIPTPNTDSSIMLQHRTLAKQLRKSSTLDCAIVRAQCPTNIIIPDRERFPEHPDYQSVFVRMNSFEGYKERFKVSDSFIRERADAGFFVDTIKRMRCFQCGNALSIHDKKLYEKYAHYDIAKLHAHFYPTCEWVKEVLGLKYVSQVLLDRTKSTDSDHQRTYQAQFSSTSTRTTLGSFSSVPSTPNTLDSLPPLGTNISDYSDDSDYGADYEPVASPFKSHFNEHMQPQKSFSSLSCESSTTESEVCIDALHQPTSPISVNQINPVQQWAAQASLSPPTDMLRNDVLPADPVALFADESYRLSSFRKHNCDSFAQMKVEELAYAGFYLNAEGTMLQCPWCAVQITEEKFEDIIERRPIIPNSPLNNEPWTAMRVHRHENGQFVGREHSCCPWVTRKLAGLYPNVKMHESDMKYPEYPSYASVEKRIKSFESDWIYPSGSRLSNVMMASAGYIYVGEGKVCCYYCGNKLCNFEPLDCPFEEHAIFNPLCDYIVQKRGLSYIERILKECPQQFCARQRCEVYEKQTIKYIYYTRSRPSINKSKRQPVKRVNSRPSNVFQRTPSTSTTHHSDIIENDCHICYGNQATYEYEPCRHSPMCGECFAKLNSEQHEECIICRRRATIHSRVTIVSF